MSIRIIQSKYDYNLDEFLNNILTLYIHNKKNQL